MGWRESWGVVEDLVGVWLRIELGCGLERELGCGLERKLGCGLRI